LGNQKALLIPLIWRFAIFGESKSHLDSVHSAIWAFWGTVQNFIINLSVKLQCAEINGQVS
jgi:hypothetical protein